MAAFVIALTADAIQFPLTAGMLFGATAPLLEGADVVIDVIIMVLTTCLLGFHWALLPSFLLEAIPGLDLAPTWTGCVAFVVWRRRRQPTPGQPPHDTAVEVSRRITDRTP